MCVGFLYTEWPNKPSGFFFTRTFRNSNLFSFCSSIVNFMLGCKVAMVRSLKPDKLKRFSLFQNPPPHFSAQSSYSVGALVPSRGLVTRV